MPDVAVHPPAQHRSSDTPNPLPPLLRTPSGLALVELQGTISTSGVSDGPNESDLATAITLGKLAFPGYNSERPEDHNNWDGKRVLLFVGQHQRMTGEVKKLAKPIAVLRRRAADDPVSEEFEVAEIIHFKVLFAHRPEPMGAEELQPPDP